MNKLIIADIVSLNSEGKRVGHYHALYSNYKSLFEDKLNIQIAGGPVYKNKYDDSELLLLPYDTYQNESLIKQIYLITRNLEYLLKNTEDDDIIIIQAAKPATCMLAMSLVGNKKRKVYFIEYDTTAINSKIKKYIFSIAQKYINGIICPTNDIGKTFNLPYIVVSDYIYTGDIFKSSDFKSKQYDFCMVGRLEKDKGIEEVAEKLANTQYKVVIAGNNGSADHNKLQKIAQTCNNITLDIGFISDEVFYGYIKNSKYSILNYQGVYTNRSSGVVLDSIFLGTPVIGRKCVALDFIEEQNIGKLFNNISMFDPSIATDESIWNKYQIQIEKYLAQHQEQKKKLLSFILK